MPGARGTVHVRAATLRPDEVTTWFGVRVTTVARTAVDLARHSRRDGIMAADAALYEGLSTPGEFDAALVKATGWPGIRRARRVLALVSAEAESPLESLTRLALSDDGFPIPELQLRIPGTAFRVDLAWPSVRLVLEVDGRGKYRGDELWREKRRETAIRAQGWRVERVIWDDVMRNWRRPRAAFAPISHEPPVSPSGVVADPQETQPHQTGRRRDGGT